MVVVLSVSREDLVQGTQGAAAFLLKLEVNAEDKQNKR